MYRKRSVPYYSVILILSIHLLINSHHSSASSHWVVTEEGKIQAQVSFFNRFTLISHDVTHNRSNYFKLFTRQWVPIIYVKHHTLK